MEEKRSAGASDTQGDEVLNILMGSDLYLELPLEERHSLVKHISRIYDQTG